jgi:hypothetical protein
MKDVRVEQEALPRPVELQVTDSIRAEWQCPGCGIGIFGSQRPGRCPKCGSLNLERTRPIFAGIGATINRIRDDCRSGAGAVLAQKHRKARFIAEQFDIARQAMDRAQHMLYVEAK